jgi:hypothetical protein
MHSLAIAPMSAAFCGSAWTPPSRHSSRVSSRAPTTASSRVRLSSEKSHECVFTISPCSMPTHCRMMSGARSAHYWRSLSGAAPFNAL